MFSTISSAAIRPLPVPRAAGVQHRSGYNCKGSMTLLLQHGRQIRYRSRQHARSLDSRSWRIVTRITEQARSMHDVLDEKELVPS